MELICIIYIIYTIYVSQKKFQLWYEDFGARIQTKTELRFLTIS